MGKKIFSLKNITKKYPGVTALDDVSMDFYEGEVHALLGENGAGKSTLIKIIAGAIAPTSGTIEFEGNVYNEMTPQKAKEYGVEYLISDFKKKNGYKRSTELSKIYGLYRQDYCGCEFSQRQRK